MQTTAIGASRRSAPAATERATEIYAKVTWRLVPILFVCYVLAYLDRINVGFAQLQMKSDLGFSDAVYGLGAGIFSSATSRSRCRATCFSKRLALVRRSPGSWPSGARSRPAWPSFTHHGHSTF